MSEPVSPVSAEELRLVEARAAQAAFKLAIRLAVDHCSELWNEGRNADDVVENMNADFLEDSLKDLGATAASGAKVQNMLTPLEALPGYADPIIFGRYSVRDYHIAPSGEGLKAYEWKDKPHRLIYDLCRALLYSVPIPPDPSAGNN